MFNELNSLKDFYNRRQNLLKKNMVENIDIDDVILNNSFIAASSIELDKQVYNYNNSINLKEVQLKAIEQNQKEFVCTFDNAVFISKIKLVVENFLYDMDSPTDFKLTVITEVGDVINLNLLPFNFTGEYIENIKFSDGRKKSLFGSKKNTKIRCYYENSMIENESIISGYDYNNHLVFKTEHRMDSVVVDYIPEGKEYIKDIGALVKVLKISTDIDFTEDQLKLLIE